MNALLERLREEFQNKESRYVYADTIINALISAQIKRLREDRALSQEDLAVLVGTKQSGISRLEKADYSAWKIETLRKLAKAFDVRLRISFEEFGTLVSDLSGFTEKKLNPCRFSDDPVFSRGAVGKGRRKRRQASNATKRARQRKRTVKYGNVISKPPTRAEFSGIKVDMIDGSNSSIGGARANAV